MSGWRKRTCGLVGAVAVAATVAACGSGARQDVKEPNGKFKVAVTSTFPLSQRLAQATHFVITVRNVDTRTIPNVAVTICNVTCSYAQSALKKGYGTSVQAFANKLVQPGLASDSRPVWIIDESPNPNNHCGYSCQQGSLGGATTAYSNTWALGALKPGKSATFDWKVTAIKSGDYTVAWQVAAGLNGRAKARTTAGVEPQGAFKVSISNAPSQSYVNNAGQVVSTG